MLGGMGSSGMGTFATWVKGLLASAFRMFPLGGANGGIIIRQKGAVAGSKESQQYNDGTRSFYDVLTGGLRVRAVNGAEYFSVYDMSGNLMMVLTGSNNLLCRGSISTNSSDGINSTGSISSSQVIVASGGSFNITNSGTTVGADVSFYRIAANVWGVGKGTTTPGGWLQNSAGRSRLTADVANATATMANLTDLSQTVIAGRKYFGQAVIYASNSTAAEGLQFDFNGGTATFTSFVYGLVGTPIGATIGVAYATSAATALTATTATTADVAYLIAFEFVCNAAGTVIPRFAEVTHTLGTATARLGSFLLTEDCP